MSHRILPILMMGIMILTGCQKSAAETGLRAGRLQPCPDTPNCVCTQDSSERHRIEPLRYAGTREEARERLLKLIGQMERASLVKAEPGYIHSEFRSAVFRFVDDVEFLFDDAAKLIHFRSAARAGTYDFKVNRNRMEDIRRRFAEPA
ncbi:MAG: DUF1499 domain-containing protein [Syntrophales bacterium]|nr:DUF1499 domain-containing protein [Syntrophales bacterium]